MRPFALILCLTVLGGTCDTQTAAQQNSAALPTHPLTNQDVVRMVKAGFGDSTIVKMVDSHGAAFDLSVDGLLKLKEAEVSQAVIDKMLSAGAEAKPAVASVPANSFAASVKPAELSQFLDEVGVYQAVHGKLVAIEPEIVNWRTGGVIKNAVTLGLDKGHVNGTVAGPRSKTTVATTPLGMAGGLVFFLLFLVMKLCTEYYTLRV